MLILGRQWDQGITLTLPDGRKGHVLVVSIRGNVVRLGFEMPDDVRILRDELEDHSRGRQREP